ncbi:cob(I)yrinic acid a,c-diamide adenosyltransferase [Candidatus Nomurabacteria bacterium]|nr:cob(I)yrinic acid a,c-diamide adenosyltransferase [Candidatus Nomurabacteria bacterium]
MPIYTKKGDQGKTSLFDGTRVDKTNARINCLGTIDELNSTIGLLATLITYDQELKINDIVVANTTLLKDIQSKLFSIGASIANPAIEVFESDYLDFTSKVEDLIDQMTTILPKLKNFILPGGNMTAAQAQVTRSVTRRAERTYFGLEEYPDITISPAIASLLNRLSDYFFTLARYLNFASKVDETIWKQ